MRKVLILLIIFGLACPAFASNYSEISGMTLSCSKGTVGSPVTITVNANGSGLYYQFFANTADFHDSPDHWIFLQEWNTNNTYTWTPDAPGFYTLVAWVNSVPENSGYNIIGAGFTVEEASSPITVDLTGTYMVDVNVTINGAFDYNFSGPFTITQTGNEIFGSYATPEGNSGSISGTILRNSSVFFEMFQESPCSGYFSGTVTISNGGNTMAGSFSGSDAIGDYEGTITFNK